MARKIMFDLSYLDRRLDAETLAAEGGQARLDEVPVRIPRMEPITNSPLATADGRDVDVPTPVADEYRKKHPRKGALEWIR